MIAAAKPTTNGTGHKLNGRTEPPSRLTRIVEPLDAVSDGEPAPDPKPAAEDKPQAGRTKQGTFAPGNKFARGNPNARRMAALRSALLEGLTPERMQALGDRLYAAALAGNMVAMKLLLTYAIGRPPEAVDADRLDLDEWRLRDAAPTLAQFLRLSADGIDPGDAATLIAKLRPQDEVKALKRVGATVKEIDEEADFGEPSAVGAMFAKERTARIGK